MLKLALFAADSVGLAAAKCLRDANVPPVCIVLDDTDRFEVNDAIRSIHKDRPFFLASALQSTDGRQAFADLQPDLGILAWWPTILRGKLLDIPRMGYLNFHPSLLPHSRGKDPNFWAIVDGVPFGVTIHFIDEGIDSGDIAFQAEIPVTWEDTGETLYRKAQEHIVELFRQNLDRITVGDIPRIAQDEPLATFHRRDELEAASRIDLDATTTARMLINRIRAKTFEGHPACRFTDGAITYEIRASIRSVEDD